jgi:hypothetical protein
MKKCVCDRGVNLFVNPAMAGHVITCLVQKGMIGTVFRFMFHNRAKGLFIIQNLTKAYNCSLKHSSVKAAVSYNETQDNYSSDVI